MDVLLGTAAVGRYLAGQTIVVENAELFSKPLGILAEQVSRFPLVLVLVLVLLLLAACRLPPPPPPPPPPPDRCVFSLLQDSTRTHTRQHTYSRRLTRLALAAAVAAFVLLRRVGWTEPLRHAGR